MIETPILAGPLAAPHRLHGRAHPARADGARPTRSLRSRASSRARISRSRPARRTTSPADGPSTDAPVPPPHRRGDRRRHRRVARRSSPRTSSRSRRPARGLVRGRHLSAQPRRPRRGEHGARTSTRSSTTPSGPELFLKDAGCRRTVGPGEPIGVRADSSWDVPEPEIGVVLGENGALAGLTIGNDVSSRDIEGDEPAVPRPGQDFRRSVCDRPADPRPRRLGGAARDPHARHRRRRRPSSSRARRRPRRCDARSRSWSSGCCATTRSRRQRPPHRHRPRPARRLHARAGPHRRDHRAPRSAP